MSSSYLDKYSALYEKNYGYDPTGNSTGEEYDPSGDWDQGFNAGTDYDEMGNWEDDEELSNFDQAMDAGDPEWDDPSYQGEDLAEDPLAQNQGPVLTEAQQRRLDRLNKKQSQLETEFQKTQEEYFNLEQGLGSQQDQSKELDSLQDDLDQLIDDLEDVEKLQNKLEKDGVVQQDGGLENDPLLGGDSEWTDMLADGEATGEMRKEIEAMKNDVQEQSDQIDAEIEAKEAAEAQKLEDQKQEGKELADTIRDAKLWTTWDGGTAGGGYDSTPDKERVYWSGNAGKNAHSIWDYYKTDQEWTHKTFDAMANAAETGNWDGFINFLESIPEANVDNALTIMYAVFNNHYSDLLPKLPAKVLKALTENTARGSIGSKQDVYYLVRGEGSKNGVKGNGEVRRGNHHVGFGVDTATLGYGEYYKQVDEKERNEAENVEDDYYDPGVEGPENGGEGPGVDE